MFDFLPLPVRLPNGEGLNFFEVEYRTLLSDFKLNVDDITTRRIDYQWNYIVYPKITEIHAGKKKGRSSEQFIRLDALTRHKRGERKISRRVLPRSLMQEVILQSLKQAFLNNTPDTLKRMQSWRRVLGSTGALADALQEDSVTAFHAAHDQFLNHVDRRAVNFMQEHNEFTWGQRNGGVYEVLKESPSDLAHERRETALAVLGQLGITRLFMGDEVCINDGNGSRRTTPFWSNIDNGMSIMTALEIADPAKRKLWRKILQAGAHVPRAIGNSLITKSYDRPYSSSEKAYELLKLSVPQTREEWAIFDKCLSWLDYYLGDDRLRKNEIKNESVPVTDVVEVAIVRRTWAGANNIHTWREFYDDLFLRHSLGKATCASEMGSQLNSAKDMIDSMYVHIVLPCALRAKHGNRWNRELKSQFREHFLSSINMRHLLRGSAYWHSDRVNFLGRVSALGFDPNHSQDNNWLPLVESITAPNGVQFIPLTNRTELKEESDTMKHCVWSYTTNCVRNGSHIFSLRNEKGARLATVEYKEKKVKGRTLIERNHIEGPRKSQTPEKAVEAADWLVDQINRGEIQPDFRVIQKRRAQLADKLGELDLGFDYNDLAVCEQIYQLYLPCLSTTIQSKAKSVAGFLRAIKFDKVLANEGIALPVQPEHPLFNSVAAHNRDLPDARPHV